MVSPRRGATCSSRCSATCRSGGTRTTLRSPAAWRRRSHLPATRRNAQPAPPSKRRTGGPVTGMPTSADAARCSAPETAAGYLRMSLSFCNGRLLSATTRRSTARARRTDEQLLRAVLRLLALHPLTEERLGDEVGAVAVAADDLLPDERAERALDVARRRQVVARAVVLAVRPRGLVGQPK